MLILYTKSMCPFCIKVQNFLDDRGISYDERDVYEQNEWMDELMQLGGKRQIPFLIDEEQGVSMYESDDIINYIIEHYGENPSVTY